MHYIETAYHGRLRMFEAMRGGYGGPQVTEVRRGPSALFASLVNIANDQKRRGKNG